jgi:ATP-dependent RNA helicase DDX3X
MADQLNGSMGNLSIDSAPQGNQGPTGRSYIPPHMRNKIGTNGPPANAPPMNGPMNGLNQSAWAG